MQGTVEDKILAPIAGTSVFVRTLRAFATAGGWDRVVIVYRDSRQRELLGKLVEGEAGLPRLSFVFGGSQRADSVRAGLAQVEPSTEFVGVHDAARPLVSPEIIRKALEVAQRDGAAVVGHRVVDTIKRVLPGDGMRNLQLEDLDRSMLWAMETPQVFRRTWLVEGYSRASEPLTDDSAAVVGAGYGVTVVPNSYPNPKITRPEDLLWAEFLVRSQEA